MLAEFRNIASSEAVQFVELLSWFNLIEINIADREENNSDGLALNTDNGDTFRWITQHKDVDTQVESIFAI